MKNNGIVKMQDACEYLGYTSGALYSMKRFKKYIIKNKGKPNQFKLQEYLYNESKKEEVLSNAWILIQYAKYICNVKYLDFFERKEKSQSITRMEIPDKRMAQHLRNFYKKNPKCVEMFIEEYNLPIFYNFVKGNIEIEF
jgi:hypothetical protein